MLLSQRKCFLQTEAKSKHWFFYPKLSEGWKHVFSSAFSLLNVHIWSPTVQVTVCGFSVQKLRWLKQAQLCLYWKLTTCRERDKTCSTSAHSVVAVAGGNAPFPPISSPEELKICPQHGGGGWSEIPNLKPGWPDLPQLHTRSWEIPAQTNLGIRTPKVMCWPTRTDLSVKKTFPTLCISLV